MDQNLIQYLEPTQQSAMALVGRQIVGSVVMLNVLRFREIADYSEHPGLRPENAISGAQAFDFYIDATSPHLLASGGKLLFVGAGGLLHWAR